MEEASEARIEPRSINSEDFQEKALDVKSASTIGLTVVLKGCVWCANSSRPFVEEPARLTYRGGFTQW
jgi:hypothetical protein